MKQLLFKIYVRNNVALLSFAGLFAVLFIVSSVLFYNLFLLVFSVFALLTYVFAFKKQLYDNWLLLKNAGETILELVPAIPQPVHSDIFTDLGIRISTDSTAIDVIQNRQIIKSIRRSDISGDTTVLCYKIGLSYFNPIFMKRPFHKDGVKEHYGIVLMMNDRTEEVLSIRNLDLRAMHIHLEQDNFQSVHQVAQNIAAHLGLKIRTFCGEQCRR